MKPLKICFKTWSTNLKLFEQAETLFQNKTINFLEIYTVPGTFTQCQPYLQKLTLPVILHAPHDKHNFNLANPKRETSNLKIFEEIKQFAQELNFPKLIIHPGQGNLPQVFKVLEKVNYPHIIIENIAKLGVNHQECIGYSPAEIQKFLDKGHDFCLDFSHAIKTACSLNKDYKIYLQEFLKLKPFMFHLCDGHINHPIDEHLNFGEGDFDIQFLKQCIQQNDNPIVTLEIPRQNHSSFQEDLVNLEYLNNLVVIS